uniref:histidine kinase n=1 Tax=Nonomuraea longicatena TaxID=83682 RepID=C9W355_9ACTN|nr:two-component system sensor kinase [Nonomuraea longicatena]
MAAEVGQLLGADVTGISRYDPDGTAAAVGGWSAAGGETSFPVGTRVTLGGRNVVTQVFETGRPMRIDHVSHASGAPAAFARERGFGAIVGVPISVENRIWGVVMVISMPPRPLPPSTEQRLADFTPLIATALATAQARTELRAFAEEQAALRRVATLVAKGAPPEEVFAAVTAEVGRLFHVALTVLTRYDPDGSATVLGSWSRVGIRRFAVGRRLRHQDRTSHTIVHQAGRAARIDEPAPDSDGDFRTIVGVPIRVEGRLWGVISVACSERTLPGGLEDQLSDFTELIGAALANAEAKAALTASRARIVAAADTARRRIERDLHDGAQQRLVSLALQLRAAQMAVPSEVPGLDEELDEVADGLVAVLDELREIARGIHPAVLVEGGLTSALKALARRSPVPVSLDVRTRDRFPEPVEIAAYYAVSEALTNAAKHARASTVDVHVTVSDGTLRMTIVDDGHGGADPARGSGLVGLVDRVEALGGRLWLESPPETGTTVRLELPV